MAIRLNGNKIINDNYEWDGHDLLPNVDDTYDLGTSAKQWKDIWIDGIANIDLLKANKLGANIDCDNYNMTKVDINTGNIASDVVIDKDPVITLTGAVTGEGTMTNLGNVFIATTATSDPTVTLTGDVTGSGTMTNLGDVSFVTSASTITTAYQAADTAEASARSSADNALQDVIDILEIRNLQEYITIGNQRWMTKNLQVTEYRDGTPIPTGHTTEQMGLLTTGAYSSYGDGADGGIGTNAANEGIHHGLGLLYNWYAIEEGESAHGGLCPEGFHVPSDDEWKELETSLGMEATDVDLGGNCLEANSTRGNEEGSLLSNYADAWHGSDQSLAESDAFGISGFNVIPAGQKCGSMLNAGWYMNEGNLASFWTSTPYNGTCCPEIIGWAVPYEHGCSYSRVISCSMPGIGRFRDMPNDYGWSIRCVGDQ